MRHIKALHPCTQGGRLSLTPEEQKRFEQSMERNKELMKRLERL